jgi:hypothetical protein
MKKFLILNILLLCFILFLPNCNAPKTKSDSNISSNFETIDKSPSKNLKTLFYYFKIQNNGTLIDMAQKAQAQWPWYPKDYNFMSNKVSEITPIINNLGLIKEINFASQKSYKYALVFCGYVGVICSRLEYLAKFIDKGIKFEKIIILSGQRKLVSYDWESLDQYKLTSEDKKLSGTKTQHELIKIVYDLLEFNKKFKNIPVIFTNTPKSAKHIPYPEDDIRYWLATNPEPGDCFVVTNQPYVYALNTQLQNLLPKDFKIIDTVGYSINPKYYSVPLWLGAVSWLLYERYIRGK